MPGTQNSAIVAVNKMIADIDAEEGFTPELIGYVDLDVEFSPVLAFRGERLGQEVEVVPTHGGRYIVRHPLITASVDAEVLKRMRLRYLLAFKAQQRMQFAPLIERLHAKTKRRRLKTKTKQA